MLQLVAEEGALMLQRERFPGPSPLIGCPSPPLHCHYLDVLGLCAAGLPGGRRVLPAFAEHRLGEALLEMQGMAWW